MIEIRTCAARYVLMPQRYEERGEVLFTLDGVNVGCCSVTGRSVDNECLARGKEDARRNRN